MSNGTARLAFLIPADPDDRWTEQAAARLVGTLALFNVPPGLTNPPMPAGPVIVEAAEVREQGHALWITIRSIGRDQ